MDDYLLEYIPIAVLFGISVFLAVLLPILSLSLGPRRPTERKSTPYESGIVPIGPAQRRLPVKFYLIAVLFILFDVDIILLLPWAVAYRPMGVYGLVTAMIFIVLFIIGDIWVWKKGAFEWD
jgi:NADH-quinone oxidoreductase subunit A